MAEPREIDHWASLEVSVLQGLTMVCAEHDLHPQLGGRWSGLCLLKPCAVYRMGFFFWLYFLCQAATAAVFQALLEIDSLSDLISFNKSL